LYSRNVSAGKNGLIKKRKKHGSRLESAVRALGVLALFVGLLTAFDLLPYRSAPQTQSQKRIEYQLSQDAIPEFLFDAYSAPGQARPVYPFSVIPRGIKNAEELKSVLAHDPVASAHYAGFSAANSRVVTVQKPRAVFVSYRLGNHIYWTKKRMWLRRGETLVSDGKNSARTRCGNRISEVAELPVSAHEPPLKMLEEPAALPSPEFDANAMAFSPLFLAASVPLLPVVDGGIIGPPSGPGVPPIFPVFCCSAGAPPPEKPPVVPPIATPEPETLMLLIFGIVFLFLFLKK